MPSLLEQRNNLITEMEGLLQKRKQKLVSWRNETTQFDKIKDEIKQIDKTIQAEQEATQIKTLLKKQNRLKKKKNAL